MDFVIPGDFNYIRHMQSIAPMNNDALNNSELRELETLIRQKQIRPVFQPIFSLADGSIHGHESLSRPTTDGVINNPEIMFEMARKYGLTSELEKLCREKALSKACSLGLEGLIFLNVCPALLRAEGHRPGFTAELLDYLELDRSRIVFELTEKTLIDDYELFVSGVAHYRSQGYRIAIDDLGDGYAGLKMLSQVVPNYVKLARFLVDKVDLSPTKQALSEALICFSKKIGALVIAEGIERHEELSYFTSIGAELGQGFFLGRPSPEPSSSFSISNLLPFEIITGHKQHLSCRLSARSC